MCPFASQLGAAAGAGGAPFPASCPMSGASANAAPAAAASAATPPSCPFSGASATKPPSQAAALVTSDAPGAAAAPAQQGGTCPLGFGGTGSGPRMSVLHCTLCRSLLFDAHKINGCGHVFCKECVSRFQDCPVCGADVTGLSPDTAAQGARGVGGMCTCAPWEYAGHCAEVPALWCCPLLHCTAVHSLRCALTCLCSVQQRACACALSAALPWPQRSCCSP